MPVNHYGIELGLWLSQADKEIPIYKAQTVNISTLTAFIPSTSGESFEFRWVNNLPSGDGIKYTISIDGREMATRVLRHTVDARTKGVNVAGGVRPFVFSPLQLKEDDDEASTVDLDKLGLIEVHVWRIGLSGSSRPPALRADSPVQATLGPVSEKAKKVGWHSVSLGAVKDGGSKNLFRTREIDPPARPYAMFRFRYKPIELLRDEGIAPSAAPAANPVESKKRARPDSDATSSAKKPALEHDVKPDISQPSGSSSQVKVEGAKRVKSEVIDLTERAHSPIRVPVNREVIEID